VTDSEGIPEDRPGRTEIDDLVDRAKDDPSVEGLTPLYQATFDLPVWCFVGVGNFPNMAPFCAKVDDIGYVMAFTNADRARYYARKHGLLALGDKPSVLSFPVREAARLCVAQQHRLDVKGVLFDDGWGNWYFPLQALPTYLDRYLPGDDTSS